MIKRPFFGIIKPKIEYERTSPVTAPREIPVAEEVTFLVEAPYEKSDRLQIKSGQEVKSGQKLMPFSDNEAYTVVTRGGKISSIFSHTGDYGRKYTGITIAVDAAAEADEAFQESAGSPSRESAAAFLRCLPGGLPEALVKSEGKLKTVVVTAVDEDLLCMTRQSIVKNETEALKKGIDMVKKISGADRVVLAVPEAMVSEARSLGVDVEGVGVAYPAANHRMIARKINGQPLAAGTSCEEAGLVFVSAEAVAALAGAYKSGRIPERKVVTVIKKNGERVLVTAVLGTPVGKLLSACSEEVGQGDRVVFGGPMTGSAIYSESFPVGPETDAVLVQDRADITEVVDRSCFNCGECVRICPANIPVNVLIRYLEAGEYGDAADKCDLPACIECGLCGFVCPAQIPVFQYIKLGKYEFALLNAVEAENA